MKKLGIIRRVNNEFVVEVNEHFRTVKDANGLVVGTESLVKAYPIRNSNVNLVEGIHVECRIANGQCPFGFFDLFVNGKIENPSATTMDIITSDVKVNPHPSVYGC